MTEVPDATSAHPVFGRELDGTDLATMLPGATVVDGLGVVWTKVARPTGTRWVSLVEDFPGLPDDTLVRLAGPIRLNRRQEASP